MLDKWVEHEYFQGNGPNETVIGFLDMKQQHHLVVVYIWKTLSNDMSDWLVLVQKPLLVE